MPETVWSQARPLSFKRLAAIALATFLVAFVVLEVVDPRWIGPLRLLAPTAAPGPSAAGSPVAPKSRASDVSGAATQGGAPTVSSKPGVQGLRGKAPGTTRAVVSDTDGQGARLRVSPDSQAEVVSVLEEGVVVELTGRETEADGRVWVEIRAPVGLGGWVAAELLTAEEAIPGP